MGFWEDIFYAQKPETTKSAVYDHRGFPDKIIVPLGTEKRKKGFLKQLFFHIETKAEKMQEKCKKMYIYERTSFFMNKMLQ